LKEHVEIVISGEKTLNYLMYESKGKLTRMDKAKLDALSSTTYASLHTLFLCVLRPDALTSTYAAFA
jgi:hypothetical protein